MRLHSTASQIVLFYGAVGAVPAFAKCIEVVEYLGQTFPLTRPYANFVEYKNAPANLPEESLERAETLMRAARFGPDFASEQDLSAALDALRFPGYGSFYANQLGARLDARLELLYVEIPGRNLNRYFAVERRPDGRMHVVDDFVARADPEIARVRVDQGHYLYQTSKGKTILRRSN
ncbi:MAG: hypothetical protein V4463_11035 [Pseudomonadota bacterium]